MVGNMKVPRVGKRGEGAGQKAQPMEMMDGNEGGSREAMNGVYGVFR